MPLAPQATALTSSAGRGGRAPRFLGNFTEAASRPSKSRALAGSSAATFVLAAIAATGLQQGGFFRRGQIAAAALLAAALVATLPMRRALDSDLRLTLLAAGLLAGWILVRALPLASPRAAGGAPLLLLGVATIVLLCRRLDSQARRLTVVGILALGSLLAMTAWWGVVWRLKPLALSSEGLWRGASTITYANALAAVLVPLCVLALALLASRRNSLPLALGLVVLLVGLATTLSRAGALALVVGVLLLCVLMSPRVVVRAVLGPLIGVTVAFVSLMPSLPVGSVPRPELAFAGLAAGLGLTALVVSTRRWPVLAAVGALLVIGALGSWSVARSESIGAAAHSLSQKRVQLSSSPRARLNAAALQIVGEHPLVGVGAGNAVIESRQDGRLRVQQYVHDEYLQVLAEEGAIGLALLAALMGGTVRLLWRSPLRRRKSPLWAGTVAAVGAAAVQAGFDFVWHVPIVLLTIALLIGLVVKPATSTNEGGLTERRS